MRARISVGPGGPDVPVGLSRGKLNNVRSEITKMLRFTHTQSVFQHTHTADVAYWQRYIAQKKSQNVRLCTICKLRWTFLDSLSSLFVSKSSCSIAKPGRPDDPG